MMIDDMTLATGIADDGEAQIPEIPLFDALTAEDRERILGVADTVRVAAGDLVMEEGTVGDGLYVLLSGELEVTKKESGVDVVLAVYGPGVFFGEMSLVEGVPRTASIRAVSDSVLLVIPPEEFGFMLRSSPDAALTIVRTVLNRLRSTEASMVQQAKLASLGTLAAGLAHELNNPTATVRRGAATLGEALERAEAAGRELSRRDPAAAARRPVDPVRMAAAPESDPILAGDREDRLAEWLMERSVDSAYELAAPLISAGWDPPTLEEAIEGMDAPNATLFLEWLGWSCTVRTVLDEVNRGADAISQIVRAVGAYSFLDQAPVQEVDVIETIENTLIILRNRLKHRIRVIREYADDLPRLGGMGGELTQLWTNLIDNAIDAMDEDGELRIVVRRDGDAICVQIVDNGTGIPEEVRPRIFDPFFTTKGLGKGTGVGLHISVGVVRRHRGSIDVDSRPGRTAFTIRLPLGR